MVSLMYHDIFEQSVTESGFQNISALTYKISRESFEGQIKEISDYCVRHSIEKKDLCFSFDDGGKSFLTLIAPLLENYGFKGYFFITTKFINTSGFLTTADIVELDQRGHYIGTHSHSHPQNIASLDFNQIKDEWEQSLNILNEILNKKVLYASVPGGFFSMDTFSILKEKGVKLIFTSTPSSVTKVIDNVSLVGRYAVVSGMKTEEVVRLIKPYSLVRLKMWVKWQVLKFLKKILGKFYFNLQTFILNLHT